jgi:predicted phage-related endonuclease
MKSTREIIESNLAWIITVLVSIGFFVATFKFQGETIARIEEQNTANLVSIDKIEKTSLADLNRQLAEAKVKLDRMEASDIMSRKSDTQVTTMAANITSLQESVSEIKIDLREVKGDIKRLISKVAEVVPDKDNIVAKKQDLGLLLEMKLKPH